MNVPLDTEKSGETPTLTWPAWVTAFLMKGAGFFLRPVPFARVLNKPSNYRKNGKPMCHTGIAIDNGKLYNSECTAIKLLFFPYPHIKK